jgi:hypothetical protein
MPISSVLMPCQAWPSGWLFVQRFAVTAVPFRKFTIAGAGGTRYSPDPRRIVEWVEEAYCETAKLMDLAELRG